MKKDDSLRYMWFGFLLVLGQVQAALATGKLLGKIELRWLWVLTPTWGLALICFALVIICVFLMIGDARKVESEASCV